MFVCAHLPWFMCVHICHSSCECARVMAHVVVRGHSTGANFSPTTWVTGIELRSVGLVASAFTCWTITLAQPPFIVLTSAAAIVNKRGRSMF